MISFRLKFQRSGNMKLLPNMFQNNAKASLELAVEHTTKKRFIPTKKMVLQSIPHSILMEILLNLDLESLCSVACVSKTLQSAAVEALPLLSTLHLPIVRFHVFVFFIFSLSLSSSYSIMARRFDAEILKRRHSLPIPGL